MCHNCMITTIRKIKNKRTFNSLILHRTTDETSQWKHISAHNASVLKKQHCWCFFFLPWLRSGCRTGRLAGAQSRAWCCRRDNGGDAGIEGCLLQHTNVFCARRLTPVSELRYWAERVCKMKSSPWEPRLEERRRTLSSRRHRIGCCLWFGRRW